MNKAFLCLVIGTTLNIMGCEAAFDPCPGQVSCAGADTCCPLGTVCSANGQQCLSSDVTTTNQCDPGYYVCGPGCVQEGAPCCNETLGLSCQVGEQCCGTGCVPLAAVCCPTTGTYCAIGQVCSGNECLN